MSTEPVVHVANIWQIGPCMALIKMDCEKRELCLEKYIGV